MLFVVFLWSVATILTPLSAEYLPLLFLARVALGIGEGLGMTRVGDEVLGLPTLYRVLSESTPASGRARAIGWLHGAGAIGQTIAAVVCFLVLRGSSSLPRTSAGKYRSLLAAPWAYSGVSCGFDIRKD